MSYLGKVRYFTGKDEIWEIYFGIGACYYCPNRKVQGIVYGTHNGEEKKEHHFGICLKCLKESQIHSKALKKLIVKIDPIDILELE